LIADWLRVAFYEFSPPANEYEHYRIKQRSAHILNVCYEDNLPALPLLTPFSAFSAGMKHTGPTVPNNL
jgi:hypothetical protein